MANAIRTSNPKMYVTWRQSVTKSDGHVLNLTLHGPNDTIIGKAKLTADQLANYILKKNGIIIPEQEDS